MRHRLLSLAAADRRLRAELMARGELFPDSHPRMRTLHDAHVRELELIIDDDGWPTPDQVELDGSEAAFQIAMRAVTRPAFTRRCLTFLKSARAQGALSPQMPAMLEDRIRVLEGKPQLFGTQFLWTSQGRLEPCLTDDEEQVDLRRAAIDLPPLEEGVEIARSEAGWTGEVMPADPVEYIRRFEQFCYDVGWR